MNHQKKLKNESKNKEAEEASYSSSSSRGVKLQGKPENNLNLCQQQDGVNFDKQRESVQHPHPASQFIALSEYNRSNPDSKSMGKTGGEQELMTNMIRYHSMASNARQIPIPRQVSQVNPSGNNRKRIIVVPWEIFSLVSLHNVQMLLQEFRFIPPSEMRKRNLRLLKEVIINRTQRGEKQQYRVIDDVTGLTNEDWGQIVAVFVMSPHTQFIGWPHKGDPAVICRHVCAFHIHFLGHPIYRELEALNLNVLQLPEFDRGKDKVIIMDFWRRLDQHMAKNPLGLGLN